MLYIVQHFHLRTSRQVRYLWLEANRSLETLVTETATGLYEIRALGLSDKILQIGSDLLDSSQRPFYYILCMQSWITLAMDLVGVIIATTLVFFGILIQPTTSENGIGLAMFHLLDIGKINLVPISVFSLIRLALS